MSEKLLQWMLDHGCQLTLFVSSLDEKIVIQLDTTSDKRVVRKETRLTKEELARKQVQGSHPVLLNLIEELVEQTEVTLAKIKMYQLKNLEEG